MLLVPLTGLSCEKQVQVISFSLYCTRCVSAACRCLFKHLGELRSSRAHHRGSNGIVHITSNPYGRTKRCAGWAASSSPFVDDFVRLITFHIYPCIDSYKNPLSSVPEMLWRLRGRFGVMLCDSWLFTLRLVRWQHRVMRISCTYSTLSFFFFF